MASGTKITLLVVVLLVVGTGVYWAAVGPGPAKTTASSPETAGGTAGGASREKGATPRPAPVPAGDRSRSVPPGTITQGPPIAPPSATGGSLPGSGGADAPIRTGGSETATPGRDESTQRVGEVSRRPGAAAPVRPIVPVDTSPGARPPVDPSIPVQSDGKELPKPGTTGIPNRPASGSGDGSTPDGPPSAGGAAPAVPPPTPAAGRQPGDQAKPVVPAPPETPKPVAPTYVEHIVAEGETMTSIAEEWFGDRGKWDLIAKANPYVDPTRLKIGQKLRLPPKSTEREAPKVDPATARGETTYVVRSGDTLSSIARVYYGSSAEWRAIYEANKALIGEDPAALKVGMALRVPPPAAGAKGP